ncbi:hypothetical protein BCT47_00340 [Vibrio splendidus]|uniref:Uncharacterized protein n=1 Tax=Vibrio splendidus TaxID=29497 RepID=A0AB35MX69_VIBSP|nr:hypothetical protein [Vibrio splendidus]MDP2500730.1 hypothetical protein [Vibrio splendidus]PMM77917.1 hypothetical protein BCT47_00340 [Vibrio splendidus]
MIDKKAAKIAENYYKELKKKGEAIIQIELEAHPEDGAFHKTPPSCKVFVEQIGIEQPLSKNKVIVRTMPTDQRVFKFKVEHVATTFSKVINGLLFKKKHELNTEIKLKITANPTELWEDRYSVFETEREFKPGRKHVVIVALEPINTLAITND